MINHRPFIWTNDYDDPVTRPGDYVDHEATWIAWLCLIVGALATAGIVAMLVA
jgi:hypothetical protein